MLCVKMSPRCLCEGPHKTFTVRKHKENYVSAHANIHSETAYDDVGEYGQGPEEKVPERAARAPHIASAEHSTIIMNGPKHGPSEHADVLESPTMR